jgi:hypothetical protein
VLNNLKRIGWQAIELGAIVVLLSIVLTAILGAEGGVVIQAIAKNAMSLLKEIPSGTTITKSAINNPPKNFPEGVSRDVR